MKHEQILIEIILEDVLAFHEEMEQRYVMDKGIHDMNLLESAVNTPFQSFAGEELYPTILDKAARLCYGLTKITHFAMVINALLSIACWYFFISMGLI